jgi:acyl-CoA reductase-like NAD-dependent aldehyde dehydrogenase
LLERVVAGVEDLKLGDPLDPETQMGPLVSREQLDRVSGFVAEGRDTANIRSGGERVAPPGWRAGSSSHRRWSRGCEPPRV